MWFRITGALTVPAAIEIEADSEQEAKERATSAVLQGWCVDCVGGVAGEWAPISDPEGVQFTAIEHLEYDDDLETS